MSEQNTVVLREVTKKVFQSKYVDIINFLNQFDLHPTLKSYAFMNLDQFAFWAKQALDLMNVELQEPVESNATLDSAIEQSESSENVAEKGTEL